MLNIDKIISSGHEVEGRLNDSFDAAILGVTAEKVPRVVYSYNKLLDILIEKGWSYEDAESYLTDTLPTSVQSLHSTRPLFIYALDHI